MSGVEVFGTWRATVDCGSGRWRLVLEVDPGSDTDRPQANHPPRGGRKAPHTRVDDLLVEMSHWLRAQGGLPVDVASGRQQATERVRRRYLPDPRR